MSFCIAGGQTPQHLLRCTDGYRLIWLGMPAAQITGDNVLIAKETARTLGMGTDIRTPEGLPSMTEDGRLPKHLGRDYAHVILPADGFAQACVLPLRLYIPLCVFGQTLVMHGMCLAEQRGPVASKVSSTQSVVVPLRDCWPMLGPAACINRPW